MRIQTDADGHQEICVEFWFSSNVWLSVGVANAVVMEAACDPFMCLGNRQMTSVKPST